MSDKSKPGEAIPTPVSFATIRDQDWPIAYLRRAMERERIPSGYLFHGPHHVGKRTTALALAKALNCRDIPSGDQPPNGQPPTGARDACNTCPSCRQVEAEVHPDVETIRPDGQFIKIDQVRGVAENLSLNPFQARKRVIVLSQAERMNPQAANAFLKTLEEPPENTLIVLCVEDASRLPETIVSRCLPVQFGLLNESTVREVLARDWPLDDEALEFAVRYARGRLRPELSGKIARWIEIRDHMTQWLIAMDKPLFAQISEEVSRWGASDDWRFVLEWLEGWFRDVALLSGGVAVEKLLNQDRLDALRQCAGQWTPEQVLAHYRTVLDTRDGLWLNANKALACEAMWLGFKS